VRCIYTCIVQWLKDTQTCMWFRSNATEISIVHSDVMPWRIQDAATLSFCRHITNGQDQWRRHNRDL